MWLRVARLLSAIVLMVLVQASVRAANSIQQTDIRPQGYGMHAAGGTIPCHVSHEAELYGCLKHGGTYTVVDTAISVDPGKGRIYFAPDTTLDGRGLLTITPSIYGLDIGVPNVIVRNVFFRLPGKPKISCISFKVPGQTVTCALGIHIWGHAENIWIDHNTFDCGNKCLNVLDNADGSGDPDAITISDNIFRNSFFGIGITAAGTAVTLPTPHHVTLYGNLFDHIFRRQPRVAEGYQVHVFNNYYSGPRCFGQGIGLGPGPGFGPSVEADGEMLFENNVADFQSCGSHIDNSDYVPVPGTGVPRGHGKIDARGNIGFVSDTDSGRNKIPGIRKDRDALGFKPNYRYRLLEADQVKASVLMNAGVQSGN